MIDPFHGLMLGVSGARGRVDENLTPEVVSRLAAAFGVGRAGGEILVARDSRVTGEALAVAVASGLCSVGCTPLLAGILTTPGAQVAVEELGCAGGIVVTASHNPAPWNGLKFIDSSGVFISSDTADALYDASRFASCSRVSWSDWPTIETLPGCTSLHLRRIIRTGADDIQSIRRRRFRLIVDCNHGASGPLIRQLSTFLDLDMKILGFEPTGYFAHEPEPRPDALSSLSKAMRTGRADLGAALDPDGDRLVFCDERGELLPEEATLPLVAEAVMSRQSGVAVTNLSTSGLLEAVAARHGGSVVRTPVGEAHVVQGMRAHRAVVGGEGNGGVIIPTIHYGRDATAGLVIMLSHMANTRRPLSDLWSDMPTLFMEKRKLSIEGRSWADIASGMEQVFQGGDLDQRDGVRFSWPDSWIHIRPSNTEPVIRVVAESLKITETARLLAMANDAIRRDEC